MARAVQKNRLLGECVPTLSLFPEMDAIVRKISIPNFRSLSIRKKFVRISKMLLQCIQKQQAPCFLLAAVYQFIERVNQDKIFDEPYSLEMFELWLNHFSGLSQQEGQEIRGKIIGRYIPRDEYQVYFPVGMGKMHQGSHVVAAHLSPDVDTTMASFWGWLDAFGCRVSEGTHQWSFPSGLSDEHARLFFNDLFGKGSFEKLRRQTSTITMCAADLMTKREFHNVLESDRGDSIDHSRTEKAVVVVDESGFYKGEWRSGDSEQVRQVVLGLSHSLRWLEGHCHVSMIRVLAEEEASVQQVVQSYAKVLDTTIQLCPAVTEISEKGKRLFHEYLRRVIGLERGCHHTFRELLVRLEELFAAPFGDFIRSCEALSAPELFTKQGILKPDRINAAKAVRAVVLSMEAALEVVRNKVEQLSHLLTIKRTVLEYPPTFLTLKSDVDEMRSKMGHFDHLTVVVPEGEEGLYPVGVVYADDVKKSVLGTASFRDFSSPEETKMAQYIEVISIVDHHKICLETSSAPTLVMGDVQSSNTLMAEQSLRLNHQRKDPFFVDEQRELCEYFSYVYGILDDTDLLSKVSRRDVVALKDMLNRMRSIVDGGLSIIVSFEDIVDDEHFVRNAAKRLLQNKNLYSIYAGVYRFREREIEEALSSAAEGRPSSLFIDTKEQNGCSRIGQVKLFHNNIKSYESHRQDLISFWQKESEAIVEVRQNVDFFLQMVSTVPSEQEVYSSTEWKWDHKDEMWIWVPEGNVAEQHLISFLNSFESSPTVRSLSFDIEIVGPYAEKRKILISQNFRKARHIKVKSVSYGPTIIFLRYQAGAINSRKSQVSPFLPKVIQ